VRECTDRQILDNFKIVEDFLEFSGGFASQMRGYLGIAGDIDRTVSPAQLIDIYRYVLISGLPTGRITSWPKFP
jgi:hypothetical protein